MQDRRDEGQRAGGCGGRLARHMSPDRHGIGHGPRQPGARQDRSQRAEEEREVTPRPRADQGGRAGAGRRQQGAEPLVDPRDPRDERAVPPPTAGPGPLDPFGRRPKVGDDPHDRPVGRLHLVDVLDPPHRHPRGQVEPELAEGPLEPGPVQEQVGPAVEPQAIPLDPRRQAAGLLGGLDHADTAAATREAEGGGQPPHPGPDDDDGPVHRGCLSPRSRCIARRPSRSNLPSRLRGGNAASSISGTNRVPRPLPQT